MMLEYKKRPFEIAGNCLKPETIDLVLRAKSLHSRGWRILDRWAFHSPVRLKVLEAKGQAHLLDKLMMQQSLEHKVLWENLADLQAGMTEAEVLEREGVSLALRLD